MYRRISMAQTSFGTMEICSRHGDNLGKSFSIFFTIMVCGVYSLELP